MWKKYRSVANATLLQINTSEFGVCHAFYCWKMFCWLCSSSCSKLIAYRNCSIILSDIPTSCPYMWFYYEKNIVDIGIDMHILGWRSTDKLFEVYIYCIACYFWSGSTDAECISSRHGCVKIQERKNGLYHVCYEWPLFVSKDIV